MDLGRFELYRHPILLDRIFSRAWWFLPRLATVHAQVNSIVYDWSFRLSGICVNISAGNGAMHQSYLAGEMHRFLYRHKNRLDVKSLDKNRTTIFCVSSSMIGIALHYSIEVF